MAGHGVVALAVLAAYCLLLQLPAASRGQQLQVGFYNTSCPNAETLVRQAVTNAFANDSGIAAGLIRLHFHDCFVRGCDASVLLTSPNNTAERDAAPNNPSLRGFQVIDAAKAAVESACPRTVSCADIVAFAARDSVNLTGNVSYQVPSGRRDGNVSIDQDALNNLPQPTFTAAQLVASFANKSLTAEEMVILSGAHTVGRSFCTSFLARIWNNTTPIVDTGLSTAYATLLRALCPSNANSSTPTTTAIDPSTPATLDNNYYKLLPLNLGLFFSDNQLRANATLSASADSFAANETLWKQRFAAAMVKMGNIEVLTGSQGQVRLNCSVVNNGSSSGAGTAAYHYSGSTVSIDEIASS
ncbi:peroxidase 1-like [Oryza brachyantha]|uniref:peroxidase 1-like n=1 Tax=Oryza brachyantha TaxID=4533 RepID=UPI001ADD5387|nr:peroxidase 1-like [Oryza brachyantha]